MTYKEVIKEKLIKAANEYCKLINNDFIIASNQFIYQKEYLLRFHKGNFLHLTGVETNLKAKDFYEKCICGTISLTDFDCDSTNEIKGKVKEKLKNLVTIGEFFEKTLVFQELFKKNRIECKLASSDGKCTLDFININDVFCVPLTLLNKKQINEDNQIKDICIIRKQR